jgi:hypothetical protein
MNILIATPCYGGLVTHNYLNSIVYLKDLFYKYGINSTVYTLGNESLITRGRAFYVALLLSNPQFTHLFFIDADISFKPESVIRMLMANKDVIAGIYPKKSLDVNKIVNAVKNNTDLSLPESILDYCINLEKTTNIKCENSIIEAMYVGTGFLMIKRDVIEKMVEAYPETKYKNDVEGYNIAANEDKFFMLFDCMIDPVSKRYLSEDFTFCHRWREMGGKIHVDINCDLTHTGTYDWKGSFKTILNFTNNTPGAAGAVEPTDMADTVENENINTI